MTLFKQTKNAAQILIFTFLLNACAGGVDATEDPIQPNEANNAANAGFNEDAGNNAENEEGGNNENVGNNLNNLNNENLGNGNGSGNNNGGPEQANQFVNNAAGENFLGNEEGNEVAAETENPVAGDVAAEENSTQDFGIEESGDIVSGNQDAGANAATVAPDANMGATDATLAPTAAPTAAPASGGIVKYVMSSGTSAYDKPSGQVVKNYEQGDHPLVSADGEWARTSDGMYVPAASLTSQPVPRAKSPKPWR